MAKKLPFEYEPEQLWIEFRNRSIPPMAPMIQVSEMRKAFLLGMWTMMGVFLGMADLPEDEAAIILEWHRNNLQEKVNNLPGPTTKGN